MNCISKFPIMYILLFFFLLMTATIYGYAQVRVKGYYRKDGTYVRPHVRSNPDGNPYNNWSYPGNVNPYTGKVATGNPESYLKNHQEKGSSMYNLTIPTNDNSVVRAVVSTKVLNIRLYPSINSSIVGKLNYFDIVEVQGIHGDWALIKYQYSDLYHHMKVLKGYVATKYLVVR